MGKCLDWNPRELGRLIGVVTSGSRSSIVPIRISRDDIGFVNDEMFVVIDDINEDKKYLGVVKSSIKKDLALDASTLPTSFDAEKTHIYSAPSMISYVEILGEIVCNNIELSFSIPRPGSYVYIVIDGKKLQKILSIGDGVKIGIHKFSSMEISLDPKSLCYHIAIIGATGTGKSRLAKCIIEEVLKVTDYSIIVFDHTGLDYGEKNRWNIDIEVVDASRIILDPDVISQIIIEEANVLSQHEDYIYSVVIEYIRRKISEYTSHQNDKRQQPITRYADIDIELITTIYRETSKKNIFTWNFNEFLQVLDEYIKKLGAYETTIRKLKLLISMRVGRRFFENYLNNRTVIVEEVIDNLLSGGKRFIVIDLSSEIEYMAKRGIVYQFMKIMWDKIFSSKGISRKILAVIDEAHNYTCTHGCDPVKSIIARTAREGRKWGFGLLLVSQRVIDLAPEIRGNINTIFFSRLQSSGDFNELKNWIEGTQHLEYTLPMLMSREFFFAGLGNPLRKPILLRVRDVD